MRSGCLGGTLVGQLQLQYICKLQLSFSGETCPLTPLEQLIFILLQICSDFATHRKKLCAQKLWAPFLRKLLYTSHEILQLMRKVSNRVEKARNCPNACKYQRVPSGAFGRGDGQQSSHGTGGGAWTKITNAKGGLTEKV